jgi:hypothetical protein
MLTTPEKREAYDRYGHAGVDPNSGMGGGGFGAGGLRRCLRRHLRRHLRRRPRWPWRRTAGIPRRRPALQPRNHAGTGCQRLRHHHPRAELGQVRHLPRQRRQAGHLADHLHHLRRPRPGAHAAGLLLGAANLPEMPRQRQDHPGTVRILRRCRTHQAQQDARSQDPCRYRQRHAHPLLGQWRAGHQRRSSGRPVRRDPHQAARRVPARRRRPALRDADFVQQGGPGWRDRSTDAGRQGVLHHPRRHPDRQDLPSEEQGHQGRALGLCGRPVLPRHRRDAGQAHRQAEGPAARTRPPDGRGRRQAQPAEQGLDG